MAKTKNHIPNESKATPDSLQGQEQTFEIETLPDIDDCVVENITRIANFIVKKKGYATTIKEADARLVLIAAILLFGEKK